MMKRNLLASLIACSFAATSMAHEGHGTPGHGHTVEHYLLEPAHIPGVVLAVAVVLASAYFLARVYTRPKKEIAKTETL